jgi:hypothetical protein
MLPYHIVLLCNDMNPMMKSRHDPLPQILRREVSSAALSVQLSQSMLERQL